MSHKMKGLGYLIIVGALLMRGLYFDGEMLLFMLPMLGLVAYHSDHLKQFKKDPVVILLGLLFLCATISLATGLDWGMGVFGLAQPMMMVLGYLFMQVLVRGEKQTRLKEGVLLVVTGTALVCLLALFFPAINQMSWVIDGRIAGPFQYANSYGALLMVVLLWLLKETSRPFIRTYLMSLILGTTLFLTYSRGSIWLTLIGLLTAIIFFLIKEGAAGLKARLGTLLGTGTSIIIGSGLGHWLQPELSSRLSQGASQASEFQTRLLYYHDALKMILERPQGYGYLGYYYYQRLVQTGSTYHVRFVHSSLLQTFLDFGILGGLVLILLALYLVSRPHLHGINRLILILLLGHSLVDLDAQFPFLWWMIWLLYLEDGSVKKVPQLGRGLKKSHLYLKRGMLALLVLFLLYLGSVSVLEEQKLEEEALRLYPWQTEAAKATLSPRDITPETYDRALKLLKRNPYIMQAWEVVKIQALTDKDYRGALEASREMLRLNPLALRQHEQYAQTLVLAARAAYEAGDWIQAKEDLMTLKGIPDQLNLLAKERDTDYNVNHKPDLRVSETLKDLLMIGESIEDIMR